MRLIDADALLEQMEKLCQKRSEESNMTGDRAVGVTWNDAVFCIKDSPAVDAVPVVHGGWIQINGHRYCNVCGHKDSPILTKYCPSCGAKMDGGDHDATD